MRNFGVKTWGVWLTGLSMAGAACSTDKPQTCSPSGVATFVVFIAAGNRPLPADTTVRVLYGGTGEEDYRLGQPLRGPVLFCDPATDAGIVVDAGPGDPVHTLRCELWTEGTATLEIRATSYAEFSQDLEAKTDECGGIVTQEKWFDLEPVDGGS